MNSSKAKSDNDSSGILLSHSKLLRRANSHKKEVLLQLLTSSHCAQRSPYLSKPFHKGEAAALRRLQNTNLIGIGFGVKETAGAFTGDLAVRVYVTKKLPNNRLSREQRIPELANGVATDVIAVGRLKFQDRPAALGASIRHVNGGAGSMGCVVSREDDDSLFLLSASHVLAPNANATAGDQILEPANGTDPIANLTDFEPLKADGAPNLFDAAIARIIRKTDVSLSIPRIGDLRGSVMEPVLYQSVRKFGAGTFHTLGVVTDIAAEISFTLEGETYLFHKVVQITGCDGDFSEGGDSGALVVDALSNRPSSLIIGGGRRRTFASPLEQVLARFKARIVH